MLQEQSQKKQRRRESGGASSRDVKKMRSAAEKAANGALEKLADAEEHDLSHEHMHTHAREVAHEEVGKIDKAQRKKAPVKKCLRRALATPEERRTMHGGCGGW